MKIEIEFVQRVKAVGSISDEARERFQSGADECAILYADKIYLKFNGPGDK